MDAGFGGTEPGDGGVAEAGAPADAGAAPVSTGPTFFTGDSGVPAAPAPDAGAGASAPGGDQVLDSAIDIAIAMASSKAAPKMQKEAQPGHATLKQGEHFNMVVSFAPGRCYTIIGFSPPGNVTQLDLKLYGPLPLTAEAGKSGANDKATPVIAKGTGALCPVLPIPASYKIDAVATKGAGRIGVQLFARDK
jgi:hypothetical protein